MAIPPLAQENLGESIGDGPVAAGVGVEIRTERRWRPQCLVHPAVSKIAVLYGVDNGVLMPACMLLNDIAAFIVGVAIVKDRLLGITVVVKKTTVYSLLAALAVFVFSVSEHLLATYVGSILGEPSAYAHVISVAVVIAAIMPVRRRLESAIDLFFARRSVSF